jgi:Tfp pilus assembly protein PilN
VRAVNLLPADLRRAGSGGGSGSGAGAFALLGVLAVAVAIVGLWAVTARQVKDREAEVASLNAEAAAAEQQAANLAGYEATVKVAKARRTSVVELIEKRFDWSDAFEEISRTVPANVWLTTMTGTVAPGITVEGGASNAQRASHTGPAIELTGCTTSQDQVAALMARLRSMKGVSRVGLSTSEKADNKGGGATDGGGKGSTDCTSGSDQRPKFSLVIFYGESAPATGTAGATAGGSQPAAAPAANASGGNQ